VKVGEAEVFADLVGVVLDPVQGGIEQHQHVVVAEQDLARRLEVGVGLAVGGQVVLRGERALGEEVVRGSITKCRAISSALHDAS